ncbi:MAG: NIPSNAP family protein [Terriglobia bacterium]|nr:NIPSNAP family protein [Terriglobia bacterium]
MIPYSDFPVVEFRRYTIRDGERENFAKYFDAYFPEAMQQLGAIAAGQFCERDNPSYFTWIRGFHSMDERAKANANLYYGPVWREHRNLMNGLMTDSDNVLLLQSVDPGCGIAVLRAVDPVKEATGMRGVAVAQIFPIKPGTLKAFMQKAENQFSSYESTSLRGAGLFVTSDMPNNFPQHPVRSDGPFVVWFGIAQDDEVADRFREAAEKVAKAMEGTNLLLGEPEVVILEPTSRSRMRWLPEWR